MGRIKVGDMYTSLTNTGSGRKIGDIITITRVNKEAVHYTIIGSNKSHLSSGTEEEFLDENNLYYKQELEDNSLSDMEQIITDLYPLNGTKLPNGAKYVSTMAQLEQLTLDVLNLGADMQYLGNFLNSTERVKYNLWSMIKGDSSLDKAKSLWKKLPINRGNMIAFNRDWVEGEKHYKFRGRISQVTGQFRFNGDSWTIEGEGGTFTRLSIRRATHEEILNSQYKHLINNQNPSKDEVQSKSKTDSKPNRSETIRARRERGKITSAKRLVSNEIKVVTRRSKVRHVEISNTILSVSRS